MIVHLITTKSNLGESITVLRRIVKTIHEFEGALSRDWIEPAYTRYVKGPVEKRKEIHWPSVHKDNLEAIAKADVLIAETTYPSFGVGYQVAVAAQQKKPTLILRHESADSDSFASGVAEGTVEYKGYNDDNLEVIVRKFLNDNDITSKDMRFNFFIDRQIYNYLRWAALKTGKTKAEILRDLVAKEIEAKDDF